MPWDIMHVRNIMYPRDIKHITDIRNPVRDIKHNEDILCLWT